MQIGEWTVVSVLNLLERDGRSIRIEPRAMELLVYLARRPGEVVSPDELIRDLWHGRVFDDGVVYRKINQLRKALGDDSRVARFIETIPKRGYRLIAPVALVPEERNAEGLAEELAEVSVSESAQAPAERRTDVSPARAGRRRGRQLVFATIGLVVVLALLAGLVLAPRGPASFDIGNETAVDARLTGAASQLPGPRRLTFEGGPKGGPPAVSPDAQKIAFTWNRDDPANFDIYVKPIGPDTRPIRVTDHPALEIFPAWSPQGDRIAFVRAEGPFAGAPLSIHTVPWSGGQTKKVADLVTPAVLHLRHPIPMLAWSPDGRYLVYGERPPDAPAKIVRFDLAERKRTVLSDPPQRTDAVGDFGPRYSPDGKRIAFFRGVAVWNLDLWLMDADGGDARRITELRMVEADAIAWTPDGQELLFTAGDGFKFRSYSINPDEGVPHPLPGLGENDRGLSIAGNRLVFAKFGYEGLRLWQVAPRSQADRSTPARDFGIDGLKLVFSPTRDRIAWQSRQSGSWQIWLADWDGGNPRPITDVALAMDPQWSPDGEQIAFYSVEPEGTDVYVVDPDTLHVRQLTVHEAGGMSPTFSHDGQSIYFCSSRQGLPQIYKMPVEGELKGEAIAVTREGGCHGFASRDGRYLYYDQFDIGKGLPMLGPIWRLSLDGDEAPVEVLPGWPRGERSWVLADNGIYWLTFGAPVLNYFDFSSRTSSEIYRQTGGQRLFYPSVSPDEQIVLIAKETPPQTDLWVFDDFR
jgi:Tol biopolymer transport system component/DNA-binding winged helix-turn-helix (wHTH) protein